MGVIGIDPSSPFTGGAVLGNRIRMAWNIGDMDVFFRSMSAHGSLGGVSIATADAVKALDAFGKDTDHRRDRRRGPERGRHHQDRRHGDGSPQPGSGDDVQMLKAGILEIADSWSTRPTSMERTRPCKNSPR